MPLKWPRRHPAHPSRRRVTASCGRHRHQQELRQLQGLPVAGSQGNYNNYVLDGAPTPTSSPTPTSPSPSRRPPRVLRRSNSLPPATASSPAASSTESPTPAPTSGTAPSSTSFATTSSTPTTLSPPPRTPSNATVRGTSEASILTESSSSSVASRNPQQSAQQRYQRLHPHACELTATSATWAATVPKPQPPSSIPLPGPTSPPLASSRPAASASRPSTSPRYLPNLTGRPVGPRPGRHPRQLHQEQYVGRVTTLQRQPLPLRPLLSRHYKLPAYYSPTNVLVTTVAGNDQARPELHLGYTWIVTPRLVNPSTAPMLAAAITVAPPPEASTPIPSAVDSTSSTPVDLRLSVAKQLLVGWRNCTPGFSTPLEDFSDDVDWHPRQTSIRLRSRDPPRRPDSNAGYLFNGGFNFGGSSGAIVNGVQTTGEPMIDSSPAA